jgi:signal peptidase II
MKRFRVFLLIASVVLLVDQATKAWIRSSLPPGAEVDLMPGWVHLSHVLNYGAAWSMLTGQRWLLVGVALVVAVGVAMAAREIGGRSVGANVGLALLFGGAIGNLIDRIATGAVTDFIDLDTPWPILQNFPIWNGADAALTVGVALLIFDFMRSSPLKTPAVPSMAAAESAALPVGEAEVGAKVL